MVKSRKARLCCLTFTGGLSTDVSSKPMKVFLKKTKQTNQKFQVHFCKILCPIEEKILLALMGQEQFSLSSLRHFITVILVNF